MLFAIKVSVADWQSYGVLRQFCKGSYPCNEFEPVNLFSYHFL